MRLVPDGPLSQSERARPESRRVLRLIACYKFAKAALVTAAGLGTLKLLDPRVVVALDHWAAALATHHARRGLVHLISWLTGSSPRRLESIAVGAFLFAVLFVVEGVGLWLGKRWAEYLTAVATTLFVPFEVVQLARMVSPARVVALVLNVALVVFLAHHLERHRARGPAAK